MPRTVRVSGIPARATNKDVKRFFDDRIRGSRNDTQPVSKVGPLCQSIGTTELQTTVTFADSTGLKQALRHSGAQLNATEGGTGRVDISADFLNLTIIHEARNPRTEKSDVDIVVIHGLNGHAWNSFASEPDATLINTHETNWLQDRLPQFLKENNMYARVMLYGFNGSIWVSGAVGGIEQPVDTLLNDLSMGRNRDPGRPLIFIAHSLGGIIVKQVVTAMNSLPDKNLIKSVKGCIFFGVPHRGSAAARTFGALLETLNAVFLNLPPLSFRPHKIHDLTPKSNKLAQITDAFIPIRHHYNIEIISCYENLDTAGWGRVVDKAAATFEYDNHPPYYGINSDHRGLVKFGRGDQHGLVTILSRLVEMIKPFVFDPQRQPTPDPSPAQTVAQALPQPKENPYFALSRFNTVFLVDDSASMWGENWKEVSQVLQECASRALEWDQDGIDIHFLNSTKSNLDNITHPVQVQSLFESVEPIGDTPIYERLKEHLDEHLKEHEANSSVTHYNLIVITDGEPSDSDYDDIEELVVKAAQTLKTRNASKTQMGIQFCQIGTNPDATAFFKVLDDMIKKKHSLDRDMVDTTRFHAFNRASNPDDAEKMYEKILLGAIVKKFDRASLADSPPLPQHQSLPNLSVGLAT